MEWNESEKLIGQIRETSRLMIRLAHAAHRHGDPEEWPRGLGRGQALVLHLLAKEDGLPQMVLAERMDIRPSSLGELVAKLEESGDVERRPNPEDKRILNVYLTEKGRAAEQSFADPRREAAERWCAALSQEEKAQLGGLLEKLNASMRESLEKSGGEFPGREDFHGCEGPYGRGMGRGGWMPHGPHFHHGHCGGDGPRREGPEGFGF